MNDGSVRQWTEESAADSAPLADSAFEQDVREFVLAKIRDPNASYTAPSVTTQFLDKFTDEYGPLGRWRTAAYIGVIQTVRPILRKNADPALHETQMELPELKLLQDRYSVPGAGVDGEPAYVPRHALTQKQMEAVCRRDRAISGHYARRADALESWWHRHNAGETH